SGLGTGKASFSGTSLTLDANATATGNAVVCMVTVGVGYSLSLSKLSVGGVGSFTFSGNNGWANQTVVTTVAGTAVAAPAQALLQPGTALRLSESAPTGWALTLVSCVDKNAAASGNPTSAWQARVLGSNSFELGADVTRPSAQISCTVTNSYGGFTISGQVLVDNGLGNGTAHDGVQNGAEQGQAGVHLSLSNCSGTVYSSGQSDGAGHFSLGTGTAPPGPVCLQQSLPSGYVLVSAQGGTAGAIYNRNSDALVFNLGANTSYSGLLFGNVPVSLLTGEGSQQVQPGQSATYGHIYTAGTSASLSLSSTDSPSVSGQSWNSVVYQDLNCNGQLDASDVVIAPSQTLNVVAGQQICLLVRVFSPANASALSTDRTRLMAMEVFQPTPAIAIGVSIRYQYKEDLSTVSSTGAALVLLKQVRKVGNCPSTAADTLAFAVSNQAAPGDYVEYQLSYSNGSAGPLSRIQIEDAVPAYTSFRSAGCGAVPTGLLGCSLTQQPVVGEAGSLQWTLKDAVQQPVGLQPGGQGTVVFCVQVQR
ncbi:MAG: hypothetical protein JOY84_18835, partial [Curvibacter sp.]|nr:hypothetical protein [Curvibacter sp.]